MSDLCKICGLAFSGPSGGGLGICPRCDCGFNNTDAQRKEIERLRGALTEAMKLHEEPLKLHVNWSSYCDGVRNLRASIAALAPKDKL